MKTVQAHLKTSEEQLTATLARIEASSAKLKVWVVACPSLRLWPPAG